METTITDRCKEGNAGLQKEAVSEIVFTKKNLVSVILLVVKLGTFFIRKNKSE